MSELRVAEFAIKNEENIIGWGGKSPVDDKENINYKPNDTNIIYGPPTTSLNSRYSDQKFSPESDVKFERKSIKSIIIKKNKEASARCDNIDGYSEDHEKRIMMEAMGLPTGFAFSKRGISPQTSSLEDPVYIEGSKKREKKTYFCQVCEIELNSEDTMNSHVNGKNHSQKESIIAQQRKEAEQRGKLMTAAPPKVIEIDNPESTKKKVPIRLHEKIKETMDPVVGLNYIKEYIAVSDVEMEPHYECTICVAQGQANGMFSHIMGRVHRQKFMDNISGDNCILLSQKELLIKAGRYRENEQKISNLIKTKKGDEEYPWPTGKAPWSIEKGGSGRAPDNARENWGKKKQCRDDEIDSKTFERLFRDFSPDLNGSYEDNSQGSASLPIPRSLKTPRDTQEAMRYLEIGVEIMKCVLNYDGLFSQKDKNSHESNLASIINITGSGLQKENDWRCSKRRRSKSPSDKLASTSLTSDSKSIF